jgi:hypothetical protein
VETTRRAILTPPLGWIKPPDRLTGCSRRIAISLIEGHAALSRLNECNRLLSTVNSESPLSAKQKNFAPVPLHFATKPEQA